MLIRTTVTNNELLERSAKAFVTLYLGIDLRAWGLTQGQAWVNLAERLLKTHRAATIQPVSARLGTRKHSN